MINFISILVFKNKKTYLASYCIDFYVYIYCCMSCQPDRTRHNMQSDWVELTSLVMKIVPSLGGPNPEYLRRQNYSDLRELGHDLAQDELRLPWQRNA